MELSHYKDEQQPIDDTDSLHIVTSKKKILDRFYNDSVMIFENFAAIFDDFKEIFDNFVAVFDDFVAIFDDCAYTKII